MARSTLGANMRSTQPQRVRPGPQHTLGTFGHVPAFTLGRRADVLGASFLACAVLTDFGGRPAVKRTCLRLERLPRLIPGGYRGSRRRRLEWIQGAGFPASPGPGMKDWP